VRLVAFDVVQFSYPVYGKSIKKLHLPAVASSGLIRDIYHSWGHPLIVRRWFPVQTPGIGAVKNSMMVIKANSRFPAHPVLSQTASAGKPSSDAQLPGLR
jgi:hypothetical protein